MVLDYEHENMVAVVRQLEAMRLEKLNRDLDEKESDI